ncbi:MAG: hypothetical protein M3O70_06110 [Actinomycetota bacterium]|nr:hypothetical protein [Actinomycetota bacterium]
MVVAALVLAGMAAAQEQELGGKLRTGPDVVVPAGERVPSDLYATGGTVRVDGAVDGDVVAAGGQVQITGRVGGDVVMAGGSLSVPGDVGGDIRAAGGQLSVGGAVREDIFFTGGQAGISGMVGEDLVFSAGQASMDGEVIGNVLGNAGGYSRQGTVGGSEKVTVGEEEKTPPTIVDHILAAVRRYGAVLLLAGLLLWLAPTVLQGAAGRLRQRPLPSLGVGLLGIVGFVVAVLVVIVVAVLTAVVLALLGLGSLATTTILSAVLAVGALNLAFAVAVVFVVDAVAGLTLGRLWSPGAATAPRLRQLGLLALGLLPVVVLTSLPVVGGWVRLVVVFFGLGALLLGAGRARRTRSTAGSPSPVE